MGSLTGSATRAPSRYCVRPCTVDFNECMSEATMDGLRHLAKVGAAVTTFFASFTANGSFGFYVKASNGVNLIVSTP